MNNNLFSYPSGIPKKYQKIITDAEELLETAEKRVNVFRNNNSDSFLYSHKAHIINAYKFLCLKGENLQGERGCFG